MTTSPADALAEALRECANDLETEIQARAKGELPRRIDRDMEAVRNARAALAAYDAEQEPKIPDDMVMVPRKAEGME